MKEKLKKFFTKERIKKILLGILWYVLSIFFLWVWSRRQGGWTKEQWMDYFVLLNVAWVVWALFHGRIQKKQDDLIARMEAEAAARNAQYGRENYRDTAAEFEEGEEYVPEAEKEEERKKTGGEGAAETYAEQTEASPEENPDTVAASGNGPY